MPALHFGLVAVRFQDGLPHVHRRRAAGVCHLGEYPARLELPGESFTVFTVREAEGSRQERHARALRTLRRHPEVVRAAPVRRHGAVRGVATDRIWVRFRPGGDPILDRLLHQGARLLVSTGEEVLLELPPDQDPSRECARLERLRGVAWAEPDAVLFGRRFAAGRAAAPGAVQPALRRIGAIRAWRLEPGRRHVTVAVLDDGVFASHPDLAGAIVARHDATGRGSAVRPKPWDSHGTECAALIAGQGAAGGVKGVASGCGLMSVRIGFTPTRLGDYITKASWIHRGVEWAWRQGASVLSMSFGGGPPMRSVRAALERARTRGRGGRGCVLVAAAGNDGTTGVEFPASLPGVIAVGATGPSDRPADFSNRGAVTLAAPGVNIRTATIPDPAEQETEEYTTDSGTSLATPLVAGAAALLVCRTPELTADDVDRHLRDTAHRPRGLRFVRGRNDRVGAGRLDVARALKACR